MSTPPIWFWQQIISPHMAGLAVALAQQGRKVVYVAQSSMSAERARQGWSAPDLGRAQLQFAPTVAEVQALVAAAPANSIHICQGIRANGLVGTAQAALAARGLRQWVVMETVDDAGWRGLLKRMEYRRLFLQWRNRIEGVLATGHTTPGWLIARGVPPNRVFPFAYFLPQSPAGAGIADPRVGGRFRLIFVGRFISLKRLDALIVGLAWLGCEDIELAVIGSGPLEQSLRSMANSLLPGQVDWVGSLPLEKVQAQMAVADCLVLPSRHDGWGAVVSEALMVGTQVICSDACGAAGIAKASSVGGVFPAGDNRALAELLKHTISAGRLSQPRRKVLAEWARCLGAEAGAGYLQEILEYQAGSAGRPVAPWARGNA